MNHEPEQDNNDDEKTFTLGELAVILANLSPSMLSALFDEVRRIKRDWVLRRRGDER